MQSRRLVLLVGILALLTLAGLSIRPAAARAFDIHPTPRDVTAGLPDGSHLCVVASSCDTIAPTSVPMDVFQPQLLLILSGIVFTIVLTRLRPVDSVDLSLTTPPPRSGAI